VASPDFFCEEVANAARAHDAGLADELCQLPRLLAWEPERALRELRRIGVPKAQLEEAGGVPAHVVPVTLVALYAALKSPGDFREALSLVL
jgi:hypothetical protein